MNVPLSPGNLINSCTWYSEGYPPQLYLVQREFLNEKPPTVPDTAASLYLIQAGLLCGHKLSTGHY